MPDNPDFNIVGIPPISIPTVGPVNAASTDLTPAVMGTSYVTLPAPGPVVGPIELGSAIGVAGISGSGTGGYFTSDTGMAIQATSNSQQFDAVNVTSPSAQHAAVSATNNGGGPAVWANASGPAPAPNSPAPAAGYFNSENGLALVAMSNGQGFDAVYAKSGSSGHAAISANNYAGGYGIWARAESADGQSPSKNPAGYFFSNTGMAIQAISNSQQFDAVNAKSGSSGSASVSASNTAPPTGTVPSGYAIWAGSNNTAIYGRGQPAAYFEGDVQVTGDLILINSPSSGDVAEDFDIEDDPLSSEPGTVVIINANGKLSASLEMYDTRVAGVISGAGELKPALVLQRTQSAEKRSPLALIGKVNCKVDASSGSIAAGDLLTTSATKGHAMKVLDRSKALGAVLGKALEPLENGYGMIRILVSLR